jgi:ABC-2 type transport system permease protein
MRGRHADLYLRVGLVAANLFLLNVLARPLSARLDLTQEKLYTISDVTRRTLAELPDRVELHGYFSEETHPKLAPLVPKIADLAEELRQIAKGKLEVSFVDPRTDEEAEKEAYRRFNVRATPFRLQSKYETGVRSAYFDLVVAFGDRFERLSFDDLVEIDWKGAEPEVRLRSLEYQLTGAIRKLVREFGSLEARLLDRKEPVRASFFISSPENLPADAPAHVREFLEKKKTLVEKATEDLAKRLKAGFEARIYDPSGDHEAARRADSSDDAARSAAARYGVRPVRASPMSPLTIYLDAVVEASGKAERLSLRDHPDRELSAPELVEETEAAIRRLLPGALRRIGIAAPRSDLSPEVMAELRRRGQSPPPDDYQALREALSRDFEVVDADLSEGRPPLDVDLLAVLRPAGWTEKQRFAFDQYLMFGGKAIVCLDRTELDPVGSRYGLRLKELAPGLEETIASYGVSLGKALLLDDRNYSYPMRVTQTVGSIRIEGIEQIPYPWFVHARGDSIERKNPVVGRIDSVVFLWPSPLVVTATSGVETLVRSSERAWTAADLRNVAPKELRAGKKPYDVPEKTARETIAVALEGPFKSAFRDRPVPTGTAEPERGIEPLFESPATARLVVVGDSDFASDTAARVLGDPGFRRNLQFFQNLCDWALLDEEMIQFRARGAGERPLAAIDRKRKLEIEIANYAAPAVLVVGFGMARALLRRRAKRRAAS